MKTFKFPLLIILIMINLSAFSQVSVTGTAYTEIVPLSTVRETVQLNAGRFSVTANGGSVTITPAGTRIANGSVILLEGPFSQGVFTLSGSANTTVSVLLPSTPQFLYHSFSSNSIFMDKWTVETPKAGNGTLIINIGATLNFKSPDYNPAGMYVGKYQIIFFVN
jgi:hypothetical protein